MPAPYSNSPAPKASGDLCAAPRDGRRPHQVQQLVLGAVGLASAAMGDQELCKHLTRCATFAWASTLERAATYLSIAIIATALGCGDGGLDSDPVPPMSANPLATSDSEQLVGPSLALERAVDAFGSGPDAGGPGLDAQEKEAGHHLAPGSSGRDAGGRSPGTHGNIVEPRPDPGSSGPDAGVPDPGTQGNEAGRRPERGAVHPTGCVPDRHGFEGVSSLIDAYCGNCHGGQPQHGAPHSLLGYDALLRPDPSGRRKVDRLVARLADGTMPPPGMAVPTQDEFRTLVAWATCEQEIPDYPFGSPASRPILSAPAARSWEGTLIRLAADRFHVPTVPDHYELIHFRSVVAEELYIRRFEALLDKAEVVHHMTLNFASGGPHRYLYSWAPGTGPVEFPDGGLPIRPDDVLMLEIHYNNSQGLEGVSDSSGVLLQVVEPQGTEYAMRYAEMLDFALPARAQSTVSTLCTATNDFHIYAAMPHMHALGSTFSHVLQRADGSEETLIALDRWSFDAQFFYRIGANVSAGDQLLLKCSYLNFRDSTVNGGLGTDNEMCFDFLYVTPADANLDCPITLPRE